MIKIGTVIKEPTSTTKLINRLPLDKKQSRIYNIIKTIFKKGDK